MFKTLLALFLASSAMALPATEGSIYNSGTTQTSHYLNGKLIMGASATSPTTTITADGTGGIITATTFSGALSGNATTATTATNANTATTASSVAPGGISFSTITTRFDNVAFATTTIHSEPIDGSRIDGSTYTAIVNTRVPYTGATSSVDLGAEALTTSGGISAGYYKINGATVFTRPNTYSTGLGVSAGLNSTGDYNTFTGYNAGLNNTSGAYNSFLGTYAGYGVSTGTYNTFIGYAAGIGGSTGSYNTALGERAGYNGTSGLGNTLVGAESGYGVLGKTYSGNTAIGFHSGYALTTGSENILLGWRAGEIITSGSRNIVIGYDEDITLVNSNNLLNIGGLIKGDLAASTVTIVGDLWANSYHGGSLINAGGEFTYGLTAATVTATVSITSPDFIGGGSHLTGVIVVATMSVNWIHDDFISQVNGTQKVFTLSQPVSSGTAVRLVLDGLSLAYGTDFTFSGNSTITVTTAPASPGTQTFFADYTINTATGVNVDALVLFISTAGPAISLKAPLASPTFTGDVSVTAGTVTASGFIAGNGTVSTPTFRGSDADTGMYFDGAGRILFGVSGSNRANIGSGGLCGGISGNNTFCVRGGNTSLGSPGAYWQSDPDTGLHRVSADFQELVAGGVASLGHTATTVTMFPNTVGTSTYTVNSGFALGTNEDLTLTGPDGHITTVSSVTASAFFGDGSHLSGLSGSISGLTAGALPYATAATTIGDSQLIRDSATSLTVVGSSVTVGGNAAFSDTTSTVTFSGWVDIGLNISNTNCDSAQSCTALCSSGYRVLGGGCYSGAGAILNSSLPNSGPTIGGAAGWYCNYSASQVTVYAEAICARMK